MTARDRPLQLRPRRFTRMTLARLTGATAVAVLGQFAVDMPASYFGPRDEMSLVGLIFCAVALTGLAIVVARYVWKKGHVTSSALESILLALNAGVFVPAIVSDSLVAGGVILWQLVTLTRHFIDRPSELASNALLRTRDPDALPEKWLARMGPAVRHISLVSLLAWISVVGYGMIQHQVATFVCLGLFAVSIPFLAQFIWIVVRFERKSAAILWLPLVAAGVAAFTSPPGVAFALLALHQLGALALTMRYSRTVAELMRHFLEYPSLFVIYTFGATIALGTVLLTFPAASATGVSIDPVDALFTATSSVCVTGLIVLDTPVDFSLVGHVIIFGLFQIGGIGMMVLSAFATVALGQRLGLKTESALAQQFATRNARDVRDLTLFIVVSTMLIEILGAAALYPAFADRGMEPLEAGWTALFHSVSAFCNAGFSLQSDSLVGFQNEPLSLGILAVLITLGGIGFAVLGEAWRRLRSRQRRRVPIQVQVVLWVSLALVVVGSLLYAAVEWEGSLRGLSTVDKCVNAVFQSVTLRTAGFNSVDYGSLHLATLLVMIVFMLIGASPGGTGGGIKTSTMAVLLAVIPALSRGDANVTLFGRTVPRDVIHRAGSIVTITVLIFAGGSFALLLTQEIPFEAILFEAASAVGTVGLSVGATSELDELGKVIVTVLMFAGRVGPLTFALALGGGTPRRVQLPEESVAVG